MIRGSSSDKKCVVHVDVNNEYTTKVTIECEKIGIVDRRMLEIDSIKMTFSGDIEAIYINDKEVWTK